ncbi:MAG: phage tail sheath subtilisin-like domain-containing protein [Pyrinomonadaceae bacterium]
MEFLHPGVYVQEISSGARPIEGVSTSTAAFIGTAEKGPTDRALMVTSFAEFRATYGSFLAGSFLAHSALQFFNNGGGRLYVVRAVRAAAAASISLADRRANSTARALTITATSVGRWGNDLDIDIADGTLDPGDEFRLSVKQGGVAVEVFDNLSINPAAPNYAETVVNRSSQLIRLSVDTTATTTDAGYSQSASGAAAALVTGKRRLMVNVNGDGPQMITLADALSGGPAIAAAVKAEVAKLTPQRAGTPAAAFTAFDATFTGGVYRLTSGAGGRNSSVEVTDAPYENAAALLRLGKTNGGDEVTGASVLRPAAGVDFHLGDNAVGGGVLAVTAGGDGNTLQTSDYTNAFALLDSVRDVNIIAVPGIGTKEVVDFGSNYCQQRRDCFFIGDTAMTDDTKEEARDFVNSLASKSSYAAVYFPWLKATDPSGASREPILLPPSGFVAGIYAQTDARRGVWKAPAGTGANVGGAVGLAREVTDAEQDILNPIGVNVIRSFPAAGIVVWGARTLATRSNPEYRYVSVRRTATFLEQSIYNGIQWAVFEPNDDDLWASLRLNVTSFMMQQFRAGAFQGRTPAEAFFVQCDSRTNTQADIDAGVVNVLVGFAPLKPAEFVVLKLSQKTGQPSL